MAPDDPSGARSGPVVLRIKLRYDDVDAMVSRFAPNVGKSGLFLPTRSIQPIGAEIKFELRLADNVPVLVGLGRVKASREPDPANPKAAFGMAIELMRVTRDSRELILKMLERRRQVGLGEIAIPMPADIDAARRGDLVESQVKDATSGAVPTHLQSFESAPVAEGVPLMTAPRRQSGPLAVATVASVEALAPEPPRRKRMALSEVIEAASGPIASVQISVPGLDDDADLDVGAVLARARMLAGGDLEGELESLREIAAAPVEIDIEAASAELARQLGGAPVGRRDRSARWAPPPPAVVTTEAAAIESAAAVLFAAAAEIAAEARAADQAEAAAHADDEPAERADARATEPAGANAAAAPALEPARSADEPADAADPAGADERGPHRAAEAAPVTPAVDADSAAHAREGYIRDDGHDDDPRATTPATADQIITEPRTPALPALIHDEADPATFGAEPAADVHEVDAGQIADEIHQLDEADFEEIEHTQIGAMPTAFDEHAFATMPSVQDQAELADRLDAHLAEAEAEADSDDLGIAAAAAGQAYEAGYEQAYVPEGDLSLDSALDLPDETPEGHVLLTPPGSAAEVAPAASGPASDEELDPEPMEIEDFEILAEADAGDEDLLAAHGEADVSGEIEPAPPATERPSHSDFASRLELDDENDFQDGPDHGFYEQHVGTRQPEWGRPARTVDEFAHEPGEIDPRILSAGHALAAFEEPSVDQAVSDFDEPLGFTPIPTQAPSYDTGESSYTFAGEIPPQDPIDFDEPHGEYAPGFVPPNAFDQSDVIEVAPPPSAPTPGYHEPYPRGSAPAAKVDDVDLESALEALDVDLDDLSIPHASTELHREGAPGHHPRPTIRPPGQSPPAAAAVRQTGRNVIARAPRESGSSRVVEPVPASKSGRLQPRAETDDGILIEFDDDE